MARAVGQVIREIREAAGLPRTEVARKAKIDPSVLWRLENPKSRSQPSFDLVRRVAMALNVDLGEVSRAVERQRSASVEVSPRDHVERIIEAAEALRKELTISTKRPR